MQNDEAFQSNFFGSSVANLVFTVIFAIGAWIKGRLNQSNCKCDCGIFECNTSLLELQKVRQDIVTHQNTQRSMLEDIHRLQKELKDRSQTSEVMSLEPLQPTD